MSVTKVCMWAFVAGFTLSASLASQETYNQRAASAGDRRAKISMEHFHSRLSNSRQAEDRSTNRILLSFTRLVPANEIVGRIVELGIELEELQVCVGEDCYSFPIDRKYPLRSEPAAREEATRVIAHNEAAINRQLASEKLDATRHWLLESLRFTKAYQSRLSESDELLISGAACVASDDEIERLLVAMPSIVRAVEYQGALRRMSIPVDVFEGPNE